MKNDRYFKFLIATILAGVVLALVQPGQDARTRTISRASTTSHS